ncbi:MAG: acetate/propionate family kinase [Candidatus Acidiferrales bacterium]
MTETNQKRILTMNTGSATFKSALYEIGDAENLLVSISADHAGGTGTRLTIADATGNVLLESTLNSRDSSAPFDAMVSWLSEHGHLAGLAAAGHRLVHGGPRYKDPQRVTPEFLADIRALIPLDPDHMPAAIRGIEFVAGQFPDLPQVACFDTAFHSGLPRVARMYALPRRFYDQAIVRYGFHGLSYEYVMRELSELEGSLANGRVIVAHLGSGASMAAIKNGKSIDTSMGFTPLEGLVMATRSGDVDPGAVLYLLAGQQKKMSEVELDTLLNKQSGLLGVSETSGDMRALLDTMHKDERAADAVNLFCYRAKKYIGAYTAAIGGLDVLVFTGGIGEHAPAVRARICDGLDFLGIRLDAARNEANAALISAPESRVKVRVIQTNEDLMIARHVVSTLGWANT